MRCKKDDLAWINTALRVENKNKVVTCAEYIGYFIEGEVLIENVMIAFKTDHYWRITSSRADIVTQYGLSNVAYSPDSWLTPIPKLPTDEFIDEVLELELENADSHGLNV